MKLKKNSGFTLMELLIIVALIAVIATTVLILLNPMQQINKAKDSQRKHDMDVLRKTFEDYYNDKSCYPKPNEVCYNAKSQYAPSEAIICNICGNESAPLNFSNFSPYLPKLPCDPESPRKEFLYQVDDLVCPKWFRVYSKLNVKDDQAINDLACSGEACGPKPVYGYNFGVTSPNIDLERASAFYCYAREKACNGCGLSYQTCLNPDLNPGCQKYKKIYPSLSGCCEDNNLCVANNYYCTYIVTGECISCGYSSSECNATGKCAGGSTKRNSSCI